MNKKKKLAFLSLLLAMALIISLSTSAFSLSSADVSAASSANANNLEYDLIRGGDSFSGDDTLSDWAWYEVAEAVAIGIVPGALQNNYAATITRQEFAQLTSQAISVMSGISKDKLQGLSKASDSFPDTSDGDVSICAALGIVTGHDDGRFGPNDPLTRQQAAAMLSRTARVLGHTDSIFGMAAPMHFNDTAGQWGSEDISFISSLENPHYPLMDADPYRVMGGVGDGKFAPNAPYSRQQAFITMYRLVGSVTVNHTHYSSYYQMTPIKPLDKTGFVDGDYVWGLTGYDAQDIDHHLFKNGKWVRANGTSVLYIDHYYSPDMINYTIYTQGTDSQSEYTEHDSTGMAADGDGADTLRTSDSGISLFCHNDNWLTISNTPQWRQANPNASVPNGTYYFVHAKDGSGPPK